MLQHRTLTVRVPPSARFARTVRDQIVSFASDSEVSRVQLGDFVYAVGEAVANAIQHSGTQHAIEVRFEVQHDKFVATVMDCGDGFQTDPVPSASLPDSKTEHGRGLAIMRRCTDICIVHSAPGHGTAVVLGLYLRRAA